jgi:hypothetical protein
MAYNSPLFDIDIPGMQATVNSYQPGQGFIWSTLFPLKYTRKFDIKGIEGNEGIPIAADRVAFNTSAPKKTRKKVGTWSGKLSKISVSREKDEIDINDYQEAQTLANAATENAQEKQELVSIVYDDVKFVREAMDAKVEIDAMRIASSGVQTFPASIEGEMASQDVINFNVPEANFKGASKVWSDITADGIQDIIDAQDSISKLGLPKPRYAFMEKAKFQQLQKQTAVANRLYPQVKQIALVTTEMVSLSNINAYLTKPENGFPQIIVLDTYASIEHKNGEVEAIKPWNANVVTLAPTIQLGWTYFKNVPQVQNTDALQVYGPYYKVTRYSDINPMLEVTMSEAYVQPALINRRSTVFLNTASTTWNDGESA